MRKLQKIRVYEYMKEHGGITAMQSYDDLKITRLSARIYDLRQLGVLIDQKHIVKKVNGERIAYDKYFISPDNQVSPTH